MERSVDSIGTCSLDVDVSATDASPDLSDISSLGTLRSASILTPSSPATANPHLPSYLSLACTINGYSTTTNYDSVRLARSRDASPHRLDNAGDPSLNKVYQVQNNLLSPPNLVPLPDSRKPKMGENTMTSLSQLNHLQGFYSSTTTTTKTIQYRHSSTKMYTATDSVDSCAVLENGDKCVSLKQITNGTKYSNGTTTTEHKSFIQQRVERLYGPGALAQGFFVTKRQKGKLFDDSCLSKPKKNIDEDTGKHSKSLNDDLLDEDPASAMKQSTSSPSLPVLRHLRPEFRAQLPIIKSRKSDQNNCSVNEDKEVVIHNHGPDSKSSCMQKSSTVPKLKNKENGHAHVDDKVKADTGVKLEFGGVKDGHYFLQILEDQTKRLLKLADHYEGALETPGLSEEVVGKIRSAAGKARLLVTQKMQQFRGLCSNNINQSADEAFPTTNEDLQGFWDMVMLQVDQVDNLFAEIEALKKNNWQEVKEAPKTTVVAKKPSKTQVSRAAKPTSAAQEEMRKKREQQRKQLIEERRKAMKSAQQQQQQLPNQDTIEIFVPAENS